MSRGRRIFLVVGLPVLFAWAVVGIVFDGYRIPSQANAPTLDIGDRLLARSIGGDDVSRGDMVIYRAPNGDQSHRVARVVAVAGDELDVQAGAFTINGRPADEPWLAPGTITLNVKAQKIPAGHVFVMGDNRGNSQDSRFFGPVPYDKVLKLVVVRWWPLGDFGGF